MAMRLPRSFDSCLHPVKRPNADSRSYSYVPCGNCICCVQKKQKKWEYRLFDELSCGRYTGLFITLTYDNEHLPLVCFEKDKDSGKINLQSCKLVTTRFRSGTVKDFNKTERVISPLSVHELSQFIKDEIPNFSQNHIIHYVERRFKNGKYFYNKEPKFAVAYKKDVQDFVSRLRIRLRREPLLRGLDTTFRYFICSEYGPTTFRPHYHGTLLFNNRTVAKFANKIGVFEAWQKQSLPRDKYGHSISQLINNAQANAAYVSKYVTSYTHLPAILHHKPFRPFHLQSISVPIGSSAITVTDFENMLLRGDLLRRYSYTDKDTKEQISVERPFSDSFIQRVFPKFLCHGSLDVPTITRLLTRILTYHSYGIPDYRPWLKEVYNLKFDTFYHKTVYKRITHTEFYHSHKFPADVYIPNKITTLQSCEVVDMDRYIRPQDPSKIAPYFLKCLGAHTDNVDVFLFGFDANRAVFKKLWRLFYECPWIVQDPRRYIDLYLRYYDVKSSQSFKMMSDFVEIACPTGKFTPQVFSAIYFDSLPPSNVPIWDLSSDEYDRFDRILSSFPDLCVEDFYDDSGKLKYCSMFDMPYYHENLQHARYRRRKDITRKQEKHDSSLNL